jgi:hypothetical protein
MWDLVKNLFRKSKPPDPAEIKYWRMLEEPLRELATVGFEWFAPNYMENKHRKIPAAAVPILLKWIPLVNDEVPNERAHAQHSLICFLGHSPEKVPLQPLIDCYEHHAANRFIRFLLSEVICQYADETIKDWLICTLYRTDLNFEEIGDLPEALLKLVPKEEALVIFRDIIPRHPGVMAWRISKISDDERDIDLLKQHIDNKNYLYEYGQFNPGLKKQYTKHIKRLQQRLGKRTAK